MNLVSLDYVVLAFFVCLMAVVSVFFAWYVKDSAGYLKGGHTIPWGISGISNFMSMFSTFIFVAYAGVAYEHGLIAIFVMWSTVPACLIAGKFFAHRWRRAKITTPVEYLERRFDFSTRQTFSWLGLLIRFLDNSVRLYASGIFLSTVTPLSLEWAIAATAFCVISFAFIGGLWAIVVLDTIQFVVLFGATLVLVPLSIIEAGGFTNLLDSVPQQFHWFNGPKGAPLFLLAYYLMITLKYNSNWAFIQRLFAVKDEAAARKCGYLSAALFFIGPIIFLLPPIAARALLPELADPERAYVAVSILLLPAGMMGLMIASMFSATMSALNSELNVMSGVLTNDVYKRFINPNASDTRLLWVARVATVIAGGLVTIGGFFVGNLGGAFEANRILTSIFAIPLAIPLIFGLILFRPRPLEAKLTIILGAPFALALNLGGWLSWELSLLATIAFCAAIFSYGTLTRKGKASTSTASEMKREINRPLIADEIPSIDPGFKSALSRLFAISLWIGSGFFIAVGLLAISQLAGWLAVSIGVSGLAAGFYLKRSVAKPN